MPKIDILEEDLTRATGSNVTDIPFIPGFADVLGYVESDTYDSTKTYYIKNNGVYEYAPITAFATQVTYYEAIKPQYNKAIYCGSISDFEAHFGKTPYAFQDDQEILQSTATLIDIKTGELDKSYIMAKELLARDMPIYYYAVEPFTAYFIDATNNSNEGSSLDLDPAAANESIGTYTIKLSRPLPGKKTYPITFKHHASIEISVSTSDNQKVTITASGIQNLTEAAIDKFNIEITAKANITTKSSIIMNCKSVDINNFYSDLSAYFSLSYNSGDDCLEDRGEYDIKYITTGGYPNIDANTLGSTSESTISLYSQMLTIAANRGDCVALVEDIDTQLRDDIAPNSGTSLFKKLSDTTSIDNDEYGAAFIPWAYHTLRSSIKDSDNIVITSTYLPACFNYLSTLADNIKVGANWLAMAGTTRGLVSSIISLKTNERLSNIIADKYQPTNSNAGSRAINAVTDIKPYGLCIWGNRTLKKIVNGLVGTSFLNTRNMISDIKKVAYRVAKALIFEQNDETLWLNFKSQVSPFLDQLKAGSGISDYKLLKLPTHYNGASLGKEEFACAIKIFPIYAVESFEITVVVSDNDVSVN